VAAGPVQRGLSFHGLRHTLGTTLAEAGYDAATIAAVLGQATTMAEHYSRTARRKHLVDAAIEHANAALRLSPCVRFGWAFLTIGAAHFVSRRFEEALPKLLIAVQDTPVSRRFIVSLSPATPIVDGSRKRGRQSSASRR
jgi:hypothetical protein